MKKKSCHGEEKENEYIENVLTAEYKEAITSLLFQLADDDFLYAYPWI